ncbi:MAG TPA: DUF1573 domain-containing protein [Myxococcota bacterium]|nr:DUF1573 domain-containing protein [Myxococcota bacterium]HRY94201.1 DUF1573 domain-containing protein [Myxococcota bacterium]HSA20113.1 DUF1573 domain-containing protein [Myxococcota bacterium]
MSRARTSLLALACLGAALRLAACQAAVEPALAEAPAPADGARPEIDCDGAEHRFGRVWQGAELEHTFQVINRGPGRLHLERLRAGCACTRAVLQASELGPGERAEVEVTLATRGLLGPIERQVEVLSDDPDRPALALRLVGEVAQAAAFAEDRLDLGAVPLGERRQAVVGLRGELAERVRLHDLELGGSEGWSVRVVERDDRSELEVELRAGHTPGPRDARLSARTGLAEAPRIHLALAAEVVGDLGLDRPAVSFDPFDATAPARLVSVRSARGQAFRLLGAEDPAGAVTARLRPRPARAGQPQGIELKLARAPETPRGRLRIRTDRPDQPVLELPYVVRAYARPEPPAPPPCPAPGRPMPPPAGEPKEKP